MTEPAQEESPLVFSISLGGYFIGLVLLQQLAFILAPVPVAICILVNQQNRAKVFILVAVLAGIMGVAIGGRNLIIAHILYSTLGWPIAWAILNRVAYKSLVAGLVAFVFITQVIMTNIQWEEVIREMQPLLEYYQEQRHGPEAGTLTDAQIVNLNTIIRLLENWQKVYIGFSFVGALMGACFSISWIFRAARRRTEMNPMGSFADFRPHDAIVWIAIAVALMGFADSYWTATWLQAIWYNAAIGLFALYLLNGLSILLYGLNAFKPNPLLAIAFLMVMIFLGGFMMLSIVGLFDTWGEFRKRIDARIQSANDSQDHSE